MTRRAGIKSIGIDIGGTRTRIGLVTDDGRIHSRTEFSSRIIRDRPEFVARLSEHVQKLAPAEGIRVGVAVPAVVDRASNVVARCVNLPFLEGASLDEIVPDSRTGAARLVTDIEAATFAEHRASAPRPGRFVHLRIGTGVGCGAIIDGTYVEPPRAMPGHADVLIVDHRPDAPKCRCGRRGCLEALLSQLLIGGDARVSDASTRTAVAHVHGALENISSTFSPEVICIGGGVVEGHPAFLGKLREAAGDSATGVRACPAVLGDDAGIIGAALLAAVR